MKSKQKKASKHGERMLIPNTLQNLVDVTSSSSLPKMDWYKKVCRVALLAMTLFF